MPKTLSQPLQQTPRILPRTVKATTCTGQRVLRSKGSEICRFPLVRLDGNSHSVWPRHPEAGILEATAFFVISLDSSLQVNKCSFWVVRPVTLTEGNDATELLLLETWDLPLVVPYGAFWRHGNAIKIVFTWKQQQNLWIYRANNCFKWQLDELL